jgi:tetratricopeptide (TPR) repeat protein
MAKKNKKNRRKAKSLNPKTLEQRAQNYLSTGRFRQAVDDYKVLVKHNQDAFLPGLQAAYKGLYNQRLEKGMKEEAGMILVQLEKLPGHMPVAESIRLLHKDREFAKAAAVAIKVLSKCATLSKRDAALVADALVTAFDDIPPPKDLPESVDDQLQRIHTALKAVAEQKYSEALAAIKTIGLRSIFFSWKCLIKGYCAFYNQEDFKALASFKMIAAGTVPEASAAPFLALLGHEVGEKDSNFLEQLCAIAGYPTIAPALARAEYLWQVGRFRDSHTHLLNTMAHFPALSQGLAYTLTELYYNLCFELPSDPAWKYHLHLARSAKNGGEPLEQFWTSRTAALFLELCSDFDKEILEQWDHFLGLQSLPFTRLPKVRALVYGRLGDLFSEEVTDNDPFNFYFTPRHRKTTMLRNSELARHCYEKSMEADPGAKDTQLALISFFEKTNDAASVNRHLDQVIKQFPEEKDVLFKAGIRCVQRKALVKAMNYLNQALTLDPTDRTVREQYALTCIQAAHNYALKGNADKSRALLPKVIATADADSDDFNRGRAYLYARWTAFEQLNDNDAEADGIWKLAIAHQKACELKLIFFYWVIAQYYSVPSRYLKKSLTFIKKALKGPVDTDTATALADTLYYIQGLPKPIAGLHSQIAQLEKYILRTAGTEMTRPQAKTILTYALSDECEQPKIANRCIDTMLQRNPEDAYFSFHRFMAKFHQDGFFHDMPKKRQKLEKILQLAREQKETQVAASAQKMLNEMNAVKNPEMINDLDDEFWDDDDFDDEIENQALEALEALMDTFDSRKNSSPGKKRPHNKTPKKKPKPKGPEQLELF